MARIARVIVDVPTMQTNKPFDYIIPAKYEEQVELGMRVVVPFGNGSRKVQGFVVELASATDFDGRMKEIDGLMDLAPVLNEELLHLGRVMAQKTFSFQISCYQTMLPSVLRAKYKKVIRVVDELPEDQWEKLFGSRDEISWEEAEERDLLKELMELKKRELVEVDYLVKDTVTIKTERHIVPLLSFEAYEEEKARLSKRAYKQALLLNVLQGLGGKQLPAKKIREQHELSSAVIKEGEKKGWLDQVDVEVLRDPFEETDFEQTQALKLTPSQAQAYQAIVGSIEKQAADVFLLKGVTGSGKTEVYLQAIAQVLKKGQSALMLVPEIALTPQMVHRFKSRFGEEVAVLHSGLSRGERYDEWRKIEKEEAKVVVGARSSVFAPVKNLGIVIIDEEHETSYKQDENPRYHARNAAIWRAEYHNCPVVLGSATPSLESRARATKNVYHLLELNERPTSQELPEVTIINMRDEAGQGNRSTFAVSLQEAIRQRLDKKEQVVLMLNRRGYSSFVMCRDCGFVLPCPNCDISLTLHMDTKTMKCHYCGHEEGIPRICLQCRSHTIRYYGTGTQKVEEELKQLIPEARILRMDVDTTRKKGAHEKLLKRFGEKKADILLGTQMIAKGLDFPDVTLVGVLNADTSLGLPDFRSSERTFQLLTQVSGRAGRGEEPGEVIVQTYNPEHYAIQLAQQHDYDHFYLKEMSLRHDGQYPPYYFIIRLSVSHENEMTAAKKIAEYAQYIRPALSPQAIMLGPTPKSIARTHNRYHYQVLIKYKKEPRLESTLHELLQNTQKDVAKGLFIAIDSEPVNFI